MINLRVEEQFFIKIKAFIKKLNSLFSQVTKKIAYSLKIRRLFQGLRG